MKASRSTAKPFNKHNSIMSSPKPYLVCLLLLLHLLFSLISVSASPTSSFLRKRRKSLSIIQKLNREQGPFLGLITVYPPEENAFFSTGAFQPHPSQPTVDLSGRRFRFGKIRGKSVVYVRCGVGMRNAVAATQQMIDLFNVVGIIHFGIAGSVNSSLSMGDVSIPKQFVHTGLWDWLKPNNTQGNDYIAQLDIGNYNVPEGERINLLGHIGYNAEEYYSELGIPNVPQKVVRAEVSQHWFSIAAKLEGMELERCLNSSVCLPKKPKVVIGLRGSTSNIFVDNAAYREFLIKTFGVSLVEMESAAVVMTSSANGFPVIVIRGLSDSAGEEAGQNSIRVLGPLAALNTAKAVIRFIEILP